jgi:glycosyltransferase involved in cell wall biosynthesis
MLHVCHIISGDLWAGAEVMAYTLLKSLKNSPKVNLQIILLNDGRLAEKLRKIGLNPRVFDENRFSSFWILRCIRKVFSNQPVQIIHSHRFKENILSALATAFIRNIKLVATQHGMPEFNAGGENFRHRFLIRMNFFLLRRHFDRLVAVSEDIQKQLVDGLKMNPCRVCVIRNGIDLPNLSVNLSHQGPWRVGSAGRLFPVKDFPLFLEVAKMVSDRRNDVEFLIAGDGPEKDRLHQLIRQYRLEKKVTLLGHLTDMASFYRRIDIYLSTSVHEGIPMSVLEAMAQGIPVIAPRTGGFDEIVADQRDGILIGGRRPGFFCDALLRVIADQRLFANLSGMAREKVVREFSAQVMAERYYTLYDGLLSTQAFN